MVEPEALYRHRLHTLAGDELDLARYADHVLLVVNTASRCMFTPQYEGLENLHQRYQSRGFAVLGFPCNQFGGQEPGSSDDIRQFCDTTFKVTFPMFQRVEVNGPGAHPLFVELKARATGIFGTHVIKWNFTKFLVARHAREVLRFAPVTSPQEIREEIETLL